MAWLFTLTGSTSAEQLFEEIQSAISNLMGNSSGLNDLSQSTDTSANPNEVLGWFMEQLNKFLAALQLSGNLNVSISAGMRVSFLGIYLAR